MGVTGQGAQDHSGSSKGHRRGGKPFLAARMVLTEGGFFPQVFHIVAVGLHPAKPGGRRAGCLGPKKRLRSRPCVRRGGSYVFTPCEYLLPRARASRCGTLDHVR